MSELHGSIGPTRNYENLTNLPSINDVRVVGNLTPSDLGLADDASVEEIRSALENKVDKVTGKGLSENDYTDGEKAKLEGIEAGAEKNVQSDWDASDGSDAFIKNKPSVLETVTIRGTATTKSGTNTDLDVYKTAEVDSAIDTIDNKIDTNVADLDERKAEIDGYYETFTSGQTEQLIATEAITDTEPYNYRKTGGPNDVGDRVYDTIVGGSVVWNQLVQNGDFSDGTNHWGARKGTISVSDGVMTVTPTEIATEVGLCIAYSDRKAFPNNHKVFMSAQIYPSFNCTVRMSQMGASSGDTVETVSITANNWNQCGAVINSSSTYSYGNSLFIEEVFPSLTDTVKYKNVFAVDLTAALGSTIADYVYSLETATAGAGVAWVRKYFPGIYYGYAEPHFEHVQTSAKETVGFNQWDEEWEKGSFLIDTGVEYDANYIRSKNQIPIIIGQDYYLKFPYSLGNYAVRLAYYDENHNFIKGVNKWSATLTASQIPNEARYLRFATNSGGDVYHNDICINLHGDRDGEYEAYKKRTYPLDSSLTLRGIPKLDSANRLYFAGDIYRHDGSGEYRYDLVDLGTLNYSRTGSGLFTSGTVTERIKPASSPSSPAEGIFCGLYPTVVGSGQHAGPQGTTPSADMTMSLNAYGTLYFNNTSYTDAASFKTAMSGVYLLYERKTPEPFTAEPYQYPMVVDPLGTEEFVDYAVEQGDRDVKIPCGHSSSYPADLRGKLQRLPSPTGTNGDYIVTEIDGKLYLKPYVPAVGLTAPTTEGEGE